MSSSSGFGTGTFGTTNYGTTPFGDSKDIIDQVLKATGHTRPESETSKREQILIFLNNRYQQVCMGTYWRWMKAKYDFNLEAPYSDGTASSVSGSYDISGVDTVWDATLFPSCLFWFHDSQVTYHVADVSSTTALTLESKFSEDDQTEGSYTIAKNRYKMPKEVDELLGVTINGTSKIELVGPDTLSLYQSKDPTATGIPRFAAYVRRDVDDDATYVEFWPAPDKRYQVELSYSVRIFYLGDEEDCYPIIPDRYRAILFYGACADFATIVLKNQMVGTLMLQNYGQLFVQMKNDKAISDQDLTVQPARNYVRRATRGRRQGFWGLNFFGKVED
jgi:hypothetical protein